MFIYYTVCLVSERRRVDGGRSIVETRASSTISTFPSCTTFPPSLVVLLTNLGLSRLEPTTEGATSVEERSGRGKVVARISLIAIGAS
jgi:hypothetical protein